MKNLTLLFFLFLFAGLHAQNSNRIIIKLQQGYTLVNSPSAPAYTGIAELDVLNTKYHAQSLQKLHTAKKSKEVLFVLTFLNSCPVTELVTAYQKLSCVAYAEPDAIGHADGKMATDLANDNWYSRQWSLHNSGTFSLSPAIEGADIEMESAWDIEEGSPDIIVATMDSGLRLNHPEFAGRLWVNATEIPGNDIDDDGNGYIDDINGWDFANMDNDPTDDHGHGTNVTGIIAATGNNGIGYAGIDSNCKIMTLKGLDAANTGYYSGWRDAIIYATDNGARVINLSVGGDSSSVTLQNAVNYAIGNGVVLVASMHNENNNASYYPAKFAYVIAVGSTDANDNRSAPFFWDMESGSNYGTHISVVAPGNFIYGLSYNSNTNYNSYWGGTSQAAPHVSGLASLLVAQNPVRTPAEVKAIIEATAEDQVGNPNEDVPGFDIYYGHGRINAFTALSYSLSIPDISKGNGLIIYPNPSNGVFTVSLNYPSKVNIYNTLGQQVLEKEITAKTNIISLSTPGIYLVSVQSNNTISRGKIVVR